MLPQKTTVEIFNELSLKALFVTRTVQQPWCFITVSSLLAQGFEFASIFADPDLAVFLHVDPDPALQNCGVIVKFC